MSLLAIAATSLLLLAQAHSFELPTTIAATTRYALHMVPPQGPAGSFFHQVPEADEGSGTPASEPDDINDEVVELLRQRRKPARASNPSTINGVPTYKTTGESALLNAASHFVGLQSQHICIYRERFRENCDA
jgi:hypothetical protein